MKTEIRVNDGAGRTLFEQLGAEEQEYLWDLLLSIPEHEKVELLIDLLPKKELQRLAYEAYCDSKLTTEGKE